MGIAYGDNKNWYIHIYICDVIWILFRCIKSYYNKTRLRQNKKHSINLNKNRIVVVIAIFIQVGCDFCLFVALWEIFAFKNVGKILYCNCISSCNVNWCFTRSISVIPTIRWVIFFFNFCSIFDICLFFTLNIVNLFNYLVLYNSRIRCSDRVSRRQYRVGEKIPYQGGCGEAVCDADQTFHYRTYVIVIVDF